MDDTRIFRRRETTIDWLTTHSNPKTGKPFLDLANQKAAEKFATLCETMVKGYKISNWEDKVDIGHRKITYFPQYKARKMLCESLKILGDDLNLTADIVVKNLSIREVEEKHQLGRGQAKNVLKKALDRLVSLFGYDNKNGFYDPRH